MRRDYTREQINVDNFHVLTASDISVLEVEYSSIALATCVGVGNTNSIWLGRDELDSMISGHKCHQVAVT